MKTILLTECFTVSFIIALSHYENTEIILRRLNFTFQLKDKKQDGISCVEFNVNVKNLKEAGFLYDVLHRF